MMKKYFAVLFTIFFSITCQAQFEGALTVGFSGNQIDGDGLAGFHKLGLTGGLNLYYPLQQKMDMGLELLYTQRGSTRKIQFAQPTIPFTIHLDYLEVPIFMRYKDWYLEQDDFYKAFADIGLSMGYLFGVKSTNEYVNIDNFRKFDLSFLLGVGFAFNKRWSLGLRYTRAIIPIINKRVFADAWAISYNWNVKLYYIL